jgi:hypothetical protein
MWSLLARFGAWLLGGLLAMLPSMVGQILLSLGIGVVTYTGISASVGWLKTSAVAALVALPPNVVALLSLMKVGVCISMLTSAIIVRLTLNGLSSDTVKQFVKK